jgi:(S)-ureidoglycine-glyoxylate aminotransferase
MATNLFLALRASLRNILAEGLEERFARYRRVAKVIRSGLASIGFELVVDEAFACPTVTAARTPANLPGERIRDFMREKRGILISFGPAPWREHSIRVGHMGEGTRLDRIVALLCGLEDALRDSGVDVPYGKSLTGIHAFWKG